MTEKPYGWRVGKEPPTLEDHTRVKHDILRRYVERYLQIVTATPAQRELNFTVVDGFAGGGRYTRGGLVVPGSPLLTLDAVRAIEAELNLSKPHGFRIKADFFFIEKDPAAFEYLQETIRQSPHADGIGRWIHILKGDFHTYINEIIARIQAKGTAHRSLFLLDQCGWGKVELSIVRQIYNELKNSEIFLTFNVDSLIDYLSDKTSDLSAALAAEIDDGFVRELISVKESQQVGWRAVIQHGLYGHIKEKAGARYSSPFFLMSSKSHRALWFLHLSKHWRARDEIGAIHWDAAGGSVDHRGDAGFKPLGFTPERRKNLDQFVMDFGFDEIAKNRSHEALQSQLADAILRVVTKDHEPPSVEQLFELHCNDSPVTLAMLKEAITILRDEKQLIVQTSTGKEKRSANILIDDRLQRPTQTTFPRSLLKPKDS